MRNIHITLCLVLGLSQGLVAGPILGAAASSASDTVLNWTLDSGEVYEITCDTGTLSMAAGDTLATRTGSADTFTLADVDKAIWINGVLPNNAVLKTTVVSLVSPNSIRVGLPAQLSANAGYALNPIDFAGIRIYWGNASHIYTSNITVGNQTSYTVPNLANGTWYFAVKAFDACGNESAFSNEVTKTIGTPPPQGTISINFQPSASPVPSGYTANDGTGWVGDIASRDRGSAVADPKLSTFIFTNLTATWNYPINNGNYLVSMASGDAGYGQGPHKVVVEGKTLLSGSTTINQYLTINDAPITITDGALTITIGDGSGAHTMLNYLVIKPAGVITPQLPAPSNFKVE